MNKIDPKLTIEAEDEYKADLLFIVGDYLNTVDSETLSEQPLIQDCGE